MTAKEIHPRSRASLPVRLALHAPALDYGWRTALYPAGTALSAAIVQEITQQAAAGFTVDPSTASFVPNYFLPTTAESLPDGELRELDRGRRSAAALGLVGVQYRLAGPGVHNP